MFRPIIDTIRFQVILSDSELDRIFDGRTDSFVVLTKGESGELEVSTEKWRVEFEQSWFGKLRFMPGSVLGEKGQRVGSCLFAEYSYHKWYNITNGINCDLPNDFSSTFKPVEDGLYKLGVPLRTILLAKEFAKLRRLDLSVNLKVEGALPTDIIKTFSRFSVQYQECGSRKGRDTSVYWGTSNSAFIVKMYDKYLEQQVYHKRPDATPAERLWWEKNKELVKNIVRFEVGFRPRWWNAIEDDNGGHPMKTLHGKDCDQIIQAATQKTCDLWSRINQQHGFENASFQERYALADIDRSIDQAEDLSFQIRSSLRSLVRDCLANGWKATKSKMAPATFYKYRNLLKNRWNWDVKIATAKYDPVDTTTKAGRLVVDSEDLRIMYSTSTQYARLTIPEYVQPLTKSA